MQITILVIYLNILALTSLPKIETKSSQIGFKLQPSERVEVEFDKYFNLADNTMQINDYDQSQQSDHNQDRKEQDNVTQYQLKRPFILRNINNDIAELFTKFKKQSSQLNVSKDSVQMAYLDLNIKANIVVFKVKLDSNTNHLTYEKYEKELKFNCDNINYCDYCIDNIRENEVIVTLSENQYNYTTIHFLKLQDRGEIELITSKFSNLKIQFMKVFLIDQKIQIISSNKLDKYIYLYEIQVNNKSLFINQLDKYFMTDRKIDNYSSISFLIHPIYFIISSSSSQDKVQYLFTAIISKNNSQGFYLKIKQRLIDQTINQIAYYNGINIFFANQIGYLNIAKTTSNLSDDYPLHYEKIYQGSFIEQSSFYSQTDTMIIQSNGDENFYIFSLNSNRVISYFRNSFIQQQYIIYFGKIYLQDTFENKFYYLEANYPQLIIKNGINNLQNQKSTIVQTSSNDLYSQSLDIIIYNQIDEIQLLQDKLNQLFSYDQNKVMINLEEYIIGSDFQTSITTSSSSKNLSYTAEIVSLNNFSKAQLIGIPVNNTINSMQVIKKTFLFVEYFDKENNYFVNIFFIYPKNNNQDEFYIQQTYNNQLKLNGQIKHIDKNGYFYTGDNPLSQHTTTLYIAVNQTQDNFQFYTLDIPCDSKLNKIFYDSDEYQNMIVQCGQSLMKYTIYINKGEKQASYTRQNLLLEPEDFIGDSSTFEIISNLLYIITSNRLIIYDYQINLYIKVITLPLMNQCTQSKNIIFSKSIIYVCQDEQNEISLLQYGFKLDNFSDEIYYLRKLNTQNCDLTFENIFLDSFFYKGKTEFLSLKCQKENQQPSFLIFRMNVISTQTQLYKSIPVDKMDQLLFTSNYVIRFNNTFTNFKVASYSLHHTLIINYSQKAPYDSIIDTLTLQIRCVKQSLSKYFEYQARFQRNVNSTANIINTNSTTYSNFTNVYQNNACNIDQIDFDDSQLLTGNRLGWTSNQLIRGMISIKDKQSEVGKGIKFFNSINAQFTDKYLVIQNNFNMTAQTNLCNLKQDYGTYGIKYIEKDSFEQSITVYNMCYLNTQRLDIYEFKVEIGQDNTLKQVSFALIDTYNYINFYLQTIGNIITVKGYGILIQMGKYYLMTIDQLKRVYDYDININQIFILGIEYSLNLQKYLVFTSFGDVLYFTDYSQKPYKKLSISSFLYGNGESVNPSIFLISYTLFPNNNILFVYSNQLYYIVQFYLSEEELFIKDSYILLFGDSDSISINLAAQNDSGDKTIISVKNYNPSRYQFYYYSHKRVSESNQQQYQLISSSIEFQQEYNNNIFFFNDTNIFFSSSHSSFYNIFPTYQASFQYDLRLTPNNYHVIPLEIQGCQPKSPSQTYSNILVFKSLILYLLFSIQFI